MRASEHIDAIERLLRELPASTAPTVEEILSHLNAIRALNVVENARRVEALCDTLEAFMSAAGGARIAETVRAIAWKRLPSCDGGGSADKECALLEAAAERLERMECPPHESPDALIIEHPQYPGDWTVWVEAYGRRIFGRYATRADARRAARRMGFFTSTKEA